MPNFNVRIAIQFDKAAGPQAKQLFERVVADASRASAAVQGIERNTSLLASGMRSAVAAVAGVAGLAVVGDAIKRSLAAAHAEAQGMRQVSAQLEAGLRSTGNAVGYTTRELLAQADALEAVSRADDQLLAGGQAVLLTFTKIGHDVFPQAMQASVDMAERFGTDLNSAVLQVGKALNDPIQGLTALRRVGVSFSEEQKELIAQLQATGQLEAAQAEILRELQIEFGGSAKAARAAAGGQFELQKAWDDSLKLVGQRLLPAYDGVSTWLAQQLPAATSVAIGAVQGVIRIADDLARGAGVGLKAALVAVGVLMATNLPAAAGAMGKGISAAAFSAGAAVGKLRAGLLALQATIAANPLGALAVAIGVVGLAANHFVVQWGKASDQAIAATVASSKLEGSLLRVAQAAKSGRAISQGMFDAAEESARQLQGQIDELIAKLAELEEKRANASWWNPWEKASIDVQIETNQAELQRLQMVLTGLKKSLRDVKVEAGGAAGGVKKLSAEAQELADTLEQELRGQRDLVAAWGRGADAAAKVARALEVEEEIRRRTKDLSKEEAEVIAEQIRERARLEDQVDALTKSYEAQESALEKAASLYQDLMDEVNPLSAAERLHAQRLAAINLLHKRGKLDVEAYAAAIKAAKKAYDDAITLTSLPLADRSLPTGSGYAGSGVHALKPSGTKWELTQGVKALEEEMAKATELGETMWSKIQQRGHQFADWVESDLGRAWLAMGDVVVGMLGRIDEGWARMAAQALVGAQQVAQAWTAAMQAQNTGQAAMAGAAMGAGVYQMGQGLGLWNAGRGQGALGGQLSGNYSDVGSQVGGVIGAIIGSYFGPAGTAVGGMLGSLIGGLIGSQIKSGADEGLAQLRQVGDEVSVMITRDEGGLGGVVGGIGRSIKEGLERILAATGGQLDFIGDLDLKVRDDKISVFVNGIKRVFKEVDEAVQFALAELLRTAEISGLSANQQAALQAARSAGAGQVSMEEVLEALDLARIADQLGLSDLGRSLDDLGDQTRVLMDRFLDLGFSQESIAALVEQLAAGFRAARQGLDDELAALTGGGSEASRMVGEWAARTRAWLQGAREYNSALREQQAAQVRRAAQIREEIATTERQLALAEQMLARRRAGEPGGDDEGEGGPGRQGGISMAALEAQIEAARERLRALGVELSSLGGLADQTAVDVEAAIMALIRGSTRLVEDFTREWLDTPAAAFERQMGTFREWMAQAEEVLRVNLELATTEEQRAAASEEHRRQLELLRQAQEAFVRQFAQQTLLGLFEGIAGLLNDGPDRAEALRQAEKLRFELQLASLQLQYAALRVAVETARTQIAGSSIVSDATLDWIGDMLNRIRQQGPPTRQGGGSGRRDAREALEERLAEAIRGPLSDYVGKLDEIIKLRIKEGEEARKTGASIEDVIKADEARRKRLKEEIEKDLREKISPRSSTGRQLDDLNKWMADIMAVRKELGLSLAEIRKAFKATFDRIVAEAKRDSLALRNTMGQFDLPLALMENADAFATMRKRLEDLAAAGEDVSEELRLLGLAEQERARLLKQQAKIDFFERLASFVKDETDRTWLLNNAARLKYSMELGMLKAQFEILSAMSLFPPEIEQRIRDILDGIPGWVPDRGGDNDNEDPTRPPVNRAQLAPQVRAIFDPTGGLRNQFRDFDDQVRTLAQTLKDAGLPTDELAALLARLGHDAAAAKAQMAAQATADLFEGVARYMKDGAEKEALLKAAAEIRYDLEMTTMRARLEFLRAEGQIATEVYQQIKGALDALPDDLPPWMQPGAGSNDNNPLGYTPGQLLWLRQQEAAQQAAMAAAQAAAQARDRALELLARYQDEGLHPLLAQLQQIEEDFAVIREGLGNTAEVQAAHAAAVQRVIDAYLDTVRDLQRQLALGEQSPFDPLAQRAMLEREYAALQARFRAGDLTIVDQLPQVIQDLLRVNQQILPTGSQAYRDLFAQLNSFLNEVLGVTSTGSTPGYGTAQPVSLQGQVEVAGIQDLRGDLVAGNASLVWELQRLRIDTGRQADATEQLVVLVSAGGGGAY